MAARYAAADAIAIAQANSCKGALLANNFRCPGEEYQFSVLEVLKDAEPARDLSGTYHGEDFMGCGLVFESGIILAVFDGNGQVLHPYSGYLNDENPHSAAVKENVRILREYRDNIVNDLSGPWSFSDSGLSCGLRHRFDGEYIDIGIDYRPQQFLDATLHSVDGTGPRGEALFSRP